LTLSEYPSVFSEKTPTKFAGIFLIFNAIAIAFLWLRVVVPPLLDGSIIPKDVAHYTTLIVQGMDLGLMVTAFICFGLAFAQKNTFGVFDGNNLFYFSFPFDDGSLR
jgi:hypothetical protein